jgi:hypothetical protein
MSKGIINALVEAIISVCANNYLSCLEPSLVIEPFQSLFFAKRYLMDENRIEISKYTDVSFISLS